MMTADPDRRTTSVETAEGEDPFRFGYRYVSRQLPDGTTEWEEVPLTLEEVLHPELDYVIPQSNRHQHESAYLREVFRARLAGVQGALVLCDCCVDLNLPGVKHICPDVAVFFNVPNPDQDWTMFLCREEKTRPELIVEVVSPSTRVNDVETKLPWYHQAGVPLYLVVDRERVKGPRRLILYRHTPTGYEEVPPDDEGGVTLDFLGVRVLLREERVVCFDAQTRRELGDYVEVYHLGQDAEQKARDEAQAREQAEQQARDEAKAREQAEQKAREEARAREQAEQKAQAEALARADLERRLQELQAKLQERGESGG
jgi:colicin import membrane protein